MNTSKEKAPPGRCYIAVGPFVWQRGDTPAAALAGLKKRLRGSSIKLAKYVIYDAPEDTYVDNSGYLSWKHTGNRDDEPKEIEKGEFKRRA